MAPIVMIAGEIERLLEVERELEIVLAQARSEASAIEEEAELDRTARERARLEALEEEIAARKRDLLRAAAEALTQIAADAEARARRYELDGADVTRFADRIAELVAGRAEP